MNFIPGNPEFVAVVRASFAQQGLMQMLGATLDRVEAGAVDISMPYRENLTQQHGFVHGAAITAIADSASGYAALSLMPAGSEVLTIEFKVNLSQLAQAGRRNSLCRRRPRGQTGEDHYGFPRRGVCSCRRRSSPYRHPARHDDRASGIEKTRKLFLEIFNPL